MCYPTHRARSSMFAAPSLLHFVAFAQMCMCKEWQKCEDNTCQLCLCLLASLPYQRLANLTPSRNCRQQAQVSHCSCKDSVQVEGLFAEGMCPLTERHLPVGLPLPLLLLCSRSFFILLLLAFGRPATLLLYSRDCCGRVLGWSSSACCDVFQYDS